MRRLLAFAALVTCAATARAQSATGLPDHFMFGLEAGQGDTWLPQSGIPWDFTFQYLAGGVNTGQGWETWNPNGTFVLNYARDARQHGYIPMFPYYEILQSRGNCGNCDENRKDITNLNDAALLDITQRQTFRYFWDFAHPVSGLARERSHGPVPRGLDTVTIGGTG